MVILVVAALAARRRPPRARTPQDPARSAFVQIAARFSDDVPSFTGAALRKRYPAVRAWPADAKLALYLLAWMLGPGFALKGFRESVNIYEPDFAAAARAVGPGKNPADITLTGYVRTALRNAAVVVKWDLNPEALYWPANLSSMPGSGIV